MSSVVVLPKPAPQTRRQTPWPLAAILAIGATLSGTPAAFADPGVIVAPVPQPVEVLRQVTPSEMRSGSLLLKAGGPDRFVEAPRLGTDIDLTVSGPTTRARVTQHFRNPGSNYAEAIYVFPLPENAAVDTLKMVIGDRIIVADVKEKQEAKAIYEAAKAAGQKAGLLEQDRPNIFTTSLANIGPGETVLIQLEYQETVRQSGDEFSLRVPLVVGPRYMPAPILQTVSLDANGQGWGKITHSAPEQKKLTDILVVEPAPKPPVPDRRAIAANYLDPRKHAPINPVTLTVHLNAGFALGPVKSHHHAIKTALDGEASQTLTLADGAVPANRDFELTWRPATGAAPSVGLFQEKIGTTDYALAFVTPPTVAAEIDKRPREVIFVIDNSGSMGGPSMDQAKASLVFALGKLNPADRFNVIRFDDTFNVLFSDTQTADAAQVQQAVAFVSGLEASGGTEMLAPLQTALEDPRPTDAKFLRQIVFLTDGAIGNEQQMFDAIAQKRGRSRVFMVGIGSAPNSFLMSRMAEIGRGTFTHIGEAGEVEERMKALFEKLESPVVTSLSATFSAPGADVTPQALPDLYRGEPVVIAAKLGAATGTLEIKGLIGDQPWVVSLDVAQAAKGTGISKVWARRKISDAEVASSLGEIGGPESDKRILALALEHHLVSRMTSLVAVDQTPSRPPGAKLVSSELPLNMPFGWDFDKVFGPQDILTKASERADAAPAPGLPFGNDKPAPLPTELAGPAPLPAVTPVVNVGVGLPKTATDAEIQMLSGLALFALSLVFFAGARRCGVLHAD